MKQSTFPYRIIFLFIIFLILFSINAEGKITKIPITFIISQKFINDSQIDNISVFLNTISDELSEVFIPINGDSFYTNDSLIKIQEEGLSDFNNIIDNSIKIQYDPNANFKVTVIKNDNKTAMFINLAYTDIDVLLNRDRRLITLTHEFGHMYGLADEYTCGANGQDQSDCIMSSGRGFGEKCYEYLQKTTLSRYNPFIAQHCGERLKKITKEEAIQAVIEYFNGLKEKQEAMLILKSYFQTENIYEDNFLIYFEIFSKFTLSIMS